MVVAGLVGVLTLAGPAEAAADAPPPPDLVKLLGGFEQLWTPDPTFALHGTVSEQAVLRRNDELVVWINKHATPAQRFAALQDSPYGSSPAGYDQSITISTGLGSLLGPIYVRGRQSGALPLTSALINSITGSAGAFVGTGTAKNTFAYPRPFLPADPATPAVPGDDPACGPASVNASSLRSIRVGASYADPDGRLDIRRVPAAVDRTHEFSSADVALDPGYGSPAICGSGSFPSGHTTTAFQAAVTLATLLPELGPEILSRASENGNNRVVLGVHYPLDVIGGRIGGEAAVAALWSDDGFRARVLEPARRELVGYLQAECGDVLISCIAKQTPYQADPYGAAVIPGGTAQVVTDRTSAVAVATERLTYGLPRDGTGGLTPSVPDGAESLLRTVFPTMTDAQRRSVLAQTQIDSGYPLDRSGSGTGSWQRMNLAAAMSATVLVGPDGTVTVLGTGGPARVQPTVGSASPGPSTVAGATTAQVVPRTSVSPSAAAPTALGAAAGTGGTSAVPLLVWWIAAGLVAVLVGAGLVIVLRRRPRRRSR